MGDPQRAVARHTVEARLFGPPTLLIDGVPVDVGRPQVRDLFALLAAQPGKRRSAQWLVDGIWREHLPQSPRKALSVNLSRLRAVLGDAQGRLVKDAESYAIDLDGTDIGRFQEAVARGHNEHADAARAALTEALSMWTSEPFDGQVGVALEPFVASITEQRWFAVNRLAELLVADRQYDSAVQLARPFFDEQPFRERLAVSLAAALAESGRKAEALSVTAQATAALRGDLGIEPSPGLVAIERSILEGATGLAERHTPVERSSAATIVGRDQLIAQMLATDAQQPSLVLAEPGGGKTALLEAVAEQEPTALLVTVEANPHQALQTVGDICRAVIARRPEAIKGHRSVVSRFVDPDAHPTPVGRESLVAGLGAFIADEAGDVLTIIDDAQWLDQGSIDVLALLVERGATRLILASRTDADDRLATLRAASSVIELPPLTSDDIVALIDSEAPGRATDELVASFMERTSGHPLFVRLLVDRWLDGGSSETLPTSVLVAVSERLSAFRQTTVEALRIAAALGSEFLLHPLRQLRPTIDGDIEEAAVARLVVIDRTVDGARFSHSIVAESCYEMLPAGRRVSIHDQLGQILEASGSPPTEYAWHYRHAAELDPIRATAAHLDAAGHLVADFGWSEADAHLSSAHDVAQEFGLDTTILADIVVRRGAVRRMLSTVDYERDLFDGAQLAREVGNDELFAVAVVELLGHGRLARAGAVDERLLELLETALELDLPAAQRAELNAAAGLLFALTDSADRGRSLFQQSLDILASIDDVEVERAVLMRAHLGLSHPDDLSLLRQAGTRLLALAGDDASVMWEANFILFGVHVRVADGAAAAANLAELRRLTPQVRDRSREFGMAFTEAAAALLDDDVERAELLSEAMLPIGRALYDEQWVMSVYALVLVAIGVKAERLGELRPAVEQMLGVSEHYRPFQVVLAATAIADGDRAAARSALDEVLGEHWSELRREIHWTTLLYLLAPPVAAVGTREECALLYDELSVYAGQMSWNGACSQGPMDEALAVVAEALGDGQAAEMHRAAALAAAAAAALS